MHIPTLQWQGLIQQDVKPELFLRAGAFPLAQVAAERAVPTPSHTSFPCITQETLLCSAQPPAALGRPCWALARDGDNLSAIPMWFHPVVLTAVLSSIRRLWPFREISIKSCWFHFYYVQCFFSIRGSSPLVSGRGSSPPPLPFSSLCPTAAARPQHREVTHGSPSPTSWNLCPPSSGPPSTPIPCWQSLYPA